MTLSTFRFLRIHLSGLLSLFLLLALVACGGGNQQASSTPPPSNQTSTINLGIPQQALNSPVVGNLSGNTQLHVLVTLKINKALLKQLGTQQKKASGQETDLSTMANQLGITDQQYQQIKQFFGVQDLSIKINTLHTTLILDGQASTFASLLKTSFVNHQYQGRTFFAPEKPLVLPQSVTQYIQAISGLDTYTRPPHSAFSATNIHPLNASQQRLDCLNADANGGFTIQQIRQAYGFTSAVSTSSGGAKTTILLPEFAAYPQADLQHFLGCVGFRGKISVVTVNDHPPTTIDLEPLLDLEMVAGLLPNANIVIYQEANTGFAMQDVLNQIQTDYTNHHGPVDLSLSWGLAENLETQDDMIAQDNLIQTMVQGEAINVFAASGDCAAYSDSSGYPTNRTVGFPASDPYALAVGGTELSTNGAGNRTQETVWSGDPKKDPTCDNSWGSGGGISQNFQRPDWQQGPGVKNRYSNGQRQVPDVSAIADFIVMYANGQWIYSGGTSAATPIWTSALAMANEGLIAKTHYYTFGPDLIYWMAQHAANDHPYYDVTKGNNLYYPATPGWDFASGFGTPNVPGLLQALQAFLATQN